MTKARQIIDTRSFLSDGYVDRLLDQIKLPEAGAVAVLILGDDAEPSLRAHFAPLSKEELCDPECWWDDCDVYANTYLSEVDAIVASAARRWPEVQIFRVGGCTCCNGVDSLLEYTRVS